ncbi:MAG: glutamine hydrolyzing CTP synthase [Candidatus Bilamarchaeaceae archaeon]
MPQKDMKYIVILGSIMSGLGKGILSSSLGKLLQMRGYSIFPIKFDGYLNVDCGTMNPFRHGEVFVLDDGTEVDMDFGTYERYYGLSLNRRSSITGGKLFQRIIEKERKGEYLGRDVQFVPHLTDEIKNWIREAGKENGSDITIIEIGGTVGDLENGYFIEAMRQLYFEEPGKVLFIQLSYIPALSPGELKTKPTQHANRLLQSLGIKPEIIVCRGMESVGKEAREKISLYSSVPLENVFDDPPLESIYELPLILEKQGIYPIIANKLGLKKGDADLSQWAKVVDRIRKPSKPPLNIAIVGKYVAVRDAYASVKEALIHGAAANNCGINIEWIDSTELENGSAEKILEKYDGILVPGGFGKRGIEGKISAIKYAREHKVPYLGLCLGMQLMVVEYARNVCGMKDANSTEFDKDTKYPVIDFLPDQRKVTAMGGTMRLGAYDCALKKGTVSSDSYGVEKISERHRHRYEVNPVFVQQLEDKGLVVSGTNPEYNVVEICEWKDSFGVASQAHLELKSRVEFPAPLFVAFMKAADKLARSRTKESQ